VSFSDITLFELWGGLTSSAEETMLLSITPQSITDQTARVAVDSGTWNFTLKAYKGSDRILEGKKQDVSISSSSNTTLDFVLVPVIEGQGSVQVTIALPESSGVAAVITTVAGAVLDPPLEIGDNAIVYTQDHIEAGDYFITFQLMDNSNQLLAVVSEIIQIRSSLLSEKTITLTSGDFNAGPGAPSNLGVLVLGSTGDRVRYMLEWDDNSNNETGFVLDDGTDQYEIAGGRNTYGPLEGAVDATIRYRIKGVNAFGESDWTELTYTLVTELPAPTGMAATAESSGNIRIQWNSVARASGYRIYRVDGAKANGYTRVGITEDTSYRDTISMTGGSTLYSYQVSAFNGSGQSELSNAVYPPVTGGTIDFQGMRINDAKLSLYYDAACTEYTNHFATLDPLGGTWFLPWSTEGTFYFTVDFSITASNNASYTFSSQPIGPEQVSHVPRLDIALSLPQRLVIGNFWLGRWVEMTIATPYTGGWFLLIPETTGYITLDAEQTDGGLDPYMHVYDGISGTQVAYDDDSGDGTNARITYLVESGHPYMVMVRAFSSGTGSYRLRAVWGS
jgi:hypothetical protein